MSPFAALLYVAGAAHLVVGIAALAAPGIVHSLLPGRYVDAVGGRREWRGFGAGVTGIGISLLLIGNGIAP